MTGWPWCCQSHKNHAWLKLGLAFGLPSASTNQTMRRVSTIFSFAGPALCLLTNSRLAMLAFAIHIGLQAGKAPRQPSAGATWFSPADTAQAALDGGGAYHGAVLSVLVGASRRWRYQVALEMPSVTQGFVFSAET